MAMPNCGVPGQTFNVPACMGCNLQICVKADAWVFSVSNGV